MPPRWPLLALALACAAPPARPAAPPAPALRVEVRFTVKDFDPRGKKDGHLECVVINDGRRPVRVPVGYSDRFDSDVVVFGRVGTEKIDVEHYSVYWDLRLVRRPAHGAGSKVRQAVVAPGKEAVVFREALDELLLVRKHSGWTWQA